jgi:uncharacterized integral membrane protein
MNTYQGQFGTFTITEKDRQEVIIYRSGLILAALSLFLGSLGVLLQPHNPTIIQGITPLFFLFALGLGVSLTTIHIYLKPLHQLLKVFWLIGSISGLIFTLKYPQPLAAFIYTHPLSLLGVGFLFAALTGIYFKEAFCFHRLEATLLTFVVPALLLGHLCSILPLQVEKFLLSVWVLLFLVFVLRKSSQAIPDDIGDKSVFTYLEQKRV